MNTFEALVKSRQLAKRDIYLVDKATPLDRIEIPGVGPIFLKREDQSQIRSYKWRGAFHRINQVVQQYPGRPLVATSAGNHAQGVALAAAYLGVNATVFMPNTTPKLKQRAVKAWGGDFVEIRLVGDTFDAAKKAADQFVQTTNAVDIHPFDDVDIMAGQSMVGEEILESVPDIESIFVPIGGGGLASGVAAACKENAGPVNVIGVEVEGQDSMSQSIAAKSQVTLDRVDRFCDGTAVAKPGNRTFEVCSAYLDKVLVVTNEQVCAAIQILWEELRVITEPSGAIGLAGVLAATQDNLVDPRSQKIATVLTGANTDFLTLPLIVSRSQLVQPTRRYFRFEISEQNGSLISLLDQFLEDINIVDFQYGKNDSSDAFPVLGLSASPEQLTQFAKRVAASTVVAHEVTEHSSTLFRVIPFRADLTSHAVFLHVDFPDRPGALREMMREISDVTNICYFNFNDTGQSEGHALVGFEFANEAGQSELIKRLNAIQIRFREVDMAFLH